MSMNPFRIIVRLAIGLKKENDLYKEGKAYLIEVEEKDATIGRAIAYR
jgi:hypothetical protein